MASNTESIVIGDIVKQEEDGYYCREELTTLANEDIAIGEVCLLNADSKAIACGVAVDEVQTITPNVETGVDEVQTITTSVGSNADAVQTITVGGTSSGGTIKLGFRPLANPRGPILWTDTIAWNATEATMTSSVNTAIDNLLGASEVVCGTIADTASLVMVLTFSGTNATNRPVGLVSVDAAALTGASTVGVVMTTPGAGTINAGTFRLGVFDVAGAKQWTYPIAFDDNAAAIETALTDALGAVNGINVTGGPFATTGTPIVLTYDAEATFANRPFGVVEMDFTDISGCDDVSIVRTTIGEGETGGGYWRIGLINAAGTFLWTENIAHDADATAISLAITNAIGSALVVATGGPLGGASPAAVVLTWSGAAYTDLPQVLVEVDVSDIEGLAHVTVVETTSGHSSGGDATMVALTAFSDSSDGTAIFINRGPCVLDADAMTYPTSGQANAVAALKELGIVCRSEPTLTETLT